MLSMLRLPPAPPACVRLCPVRAASTRAASAPATPATPPLYSKTLLLPRTSFGPKLPQGDTLDRLITRSSQHLYAWQRAQEHRPAFVLHDGPPYANGDLHLGHALNKILKDIINRFQLLYHGSRVHYVPGWDCHGLPIEMKAQAGRDTLHDTDDTAAPMLAPQTRAACRQLAALMIARQRHQFLQFAIMTDFDHPYVTMDHDYEMRQLLVFRKLLENGLLSRQLKPVWWGCDTHTALAEAELEYNPRHRSIAASVLFPVSTPATYDALGRLFAVEIPRHHLNLLIWTSTPWTIPANKAICVNKHQLYTLIHCAATNQYLVVAHSLLDSVIASASLPWVPVCPLVTFKGDVLLDARYTNPASLAPDSYPVLHADHVTVAAGSGLVHTAPAHGAEDYVVGKRWGLPIESAVDGHGRLVASAMPPGFAALHGRKVTDPATVMQTVDLLAHHHMLFALDKHFTHSYPYDWRSKTPVVQRATPQWFVNIDKIKDTVLASLAHVRFVPESGKNRLPSFIRQRSEWCISRQRAWGVPLPFLYHRTTHEPLADVATVSHVIDRMHALGTDQWFVAEDNVGRWLPAGYDGTAYYKGTDTMDVWFDSGTSWTSLAGSVGPPAAQSPAASVEAAFAADLALAHVYLEGSDQHRGWFQSSLLNKVIASGVGGHGFKPVAPFLNIITHGFTLDAHSKKMSKSLGNVISPRLVIDGCAKPYIPAMGPDGLRLWAASSDYVADVKVTPEILARVFDNAKKMRVTFKFLLGNLNGFSRAVPYQDLALVDQLALSDLHALQHRCVALYQSYNFARVVSELNFHMNSRLSAFYFDISKDCLYTDAPDSPRRRAVQTVLKEILRTYIGLLAPIQPILTQQAWDSYCELFAADAADSPFMKPYDGFFRLPPHYANTAVQDQFLPLFALRDHVYKAVELARTSGLFKNNMENIVTVWCPPLGHMHRLLSTPDQHFDDFFLLSGVSLNPDQPPSNPFCTETVDIGGERVTFLLSPLAHHKCPRCWKFIAPLPQHLCPKCDTVVKSL